MDGPVTSGSAARAMRRAIVSLALSAASALALQGCETPYTKISPEVPAGATTLGPAEGSASSHLGPAYWFYLCFIPYAWDARAQSAYDEAVRGVPGATAVDNVTIQEDWIWWFLGTSRKLTITGDGVKR